jgi:hypothetical protein
MPEALHHIGNLHLRTPGADDHAGPRVAEHLSRALAELPAPLRDTQLGSLRLRVRVAHDASDADLAHAVARALAIALR